MNEISEQRGKRLLDWYSEHKRDLPWRRTTDPYGIWVSEIMLQQTQVITAMRYFLNWMERFPTVESLAQADEQDVLAAWQGLGYYRRCRMLLEGARFVAQTGMPTTSEEWLRVPGVGPYTAGAIASIAFQEASAVVDGNVERVFARLTVCDLEGTRLNRAAWDWANANMIAERASDWNQAIMELGATVCRPLQPECSECPVSSICRAKQLDQVSRFPKAKARPKMVHQRHIVWVPICDGRLGVSQIPPGQWWEGMWEFPRQVLASRTDPLRLGEIVGEADVKPVGRFRHAVTHHQIDLEVSVAHPSEQSQALAWFTIEELDDLALPAPQRRALEMVLRATGEFATPD
ncbi:MAG: A/G-specific adenine glycosylase [Fimbriimonas sp.]